MHSVFLKMDIYLLYCSYCFSDNMKLLTMHVITFDDYWQYYSNNFVVWSNSLGLSLKHSMTVWVNLLFQSINLRSLLIYKYAISGFDIVWYDGFIVFDFSLNPILYPKRHIEIVSSKVWKVLCFVLALAMNFEQKNSFRMLYYALVCPIPGNFSVVWNNNRFLVPYFTRVRSSKFLKHELIVHLMTIFNTDQSYSI